MNMLSDDDKSSFSKQDNNKRVSYIQERLDDYGMVHYSLESDQLSEGLILHFSNPTISIA